MDGERSITHSIGATPLVELTRIVRPEHARVHAIDALGTSPYFRTEPLRERHPAARIVVAALRAAEELGPDRTVVTLSCDSGLKYLSTELYSGRP